MDLVFEELFTHLQIALLDNPSQVHLSDVCGGFMHPVFLGLPNFRDATASEVHPQEGLNLRGRLVEPHLLEVLHAQPLETSSAKFPARVPLKDPCEEGLALEDHLLLQPLVANLALDFHPPPRLNDRRSHVVMAPKKPHIHAAKAAAHEPLDIERCNVESGELRSTEIPRDVPLNLDSRTVTPQHVANENPAHAALDRNGGVDVLPAVAVVVPPTTLDLGHASGGKLEVHRILDAEFAVPLPMTLDLLHCEQDLPSRMLIRPCFRLLCSDLLVDKLVAVRAVVEEALAAYCERRPAPSFQRAVRPKVATRPTDWGTPPGALVLLF